MRLKRFFAAPLILLKHGSLRPGSVVLPDASQRVFINPDDDRAYKKLVMDTARGRISTPMNFWRDHTRHLPESLCLDVGANYGECFAFGRYAEPARCIAVEANPVLLGCLERTRSAHPDASRIRVVNGLVSTADTGVASLFYSPRWTGGGSAIAGESGLSEAQVACRTLDSIVAESDGATDAPIVMKMDIEGYEGHALNGFSQLFERERALGILEFDTRMLTRAGTEPTDVFRKLAQRFVLYITSMRSRELQPVANWDALCALAGGRDFHRDLVFYSHPDLIAPGWKNRAQAVT